MSVFTKQFNILVVEDNPDDVFRVEKYLSDGLLNNQVYYVRSLAEMKVQLLASKPVDIILFVIDASCYNADERLQEALSSSMDLPVIIISDSVDKNFSIRSLSLGAADFLFRPELSASLLYKSILYSLERKKNLISLRESEKRYKELFHLNPVPMWVYEINSFQFLDVNQAAIDNYGYSKEEFLNMNILDIRPKVNIPEVIALINDFKNEGKRLKRITRHLKKNGEVIHVEIAGNMIDFSGRKARLVLSTDITEKMKAENALRISEQRFRALVQEGADLMTIIDTDFSFQYVSPNHESILGYSPDTLIHQNAFSFIHPDDAPRVSAAAKGLRLQGSITIAPYRVMHTNGSWVWMETTITNLLKDHTVRGIVSNSRDVGKRLEYERMLRESNERYAAVAQATSDAIWDYDLRVKRTFVSGDGYLKLFGYPVVNDYLEANFWEDHIHPDDACRVKKEIEVALTGKNEQFAVEYRFQRADGDYVYVLERAFVIYEQGQPIRIYGAKQDITSRKYHETMLEIEREIFEINATGDVPFERILEKLTVEIERLITGAICSVVLLDDENRINKVAGRSVPEEFSKAIDGLAIGPRTGSCGTAMWRGEKVIVTDIETDVLWEDFRELAAAFNFKACWSVPCKKSNGVVSGSFATYYTNPKSPKDHEVKFIERAANLVGILLDNREAGEKLRRSKERYDIVMKATSDTIWDMDLTRNRLTYNKGINKVFGYPPEYLQVNDARLWWEQTVHPEDKKKVNDFLNSVFEKKQSNIKLEYRFRCADGSYKYVYDRGFIMSDEEQNPVRIIGAMQDITRQKEEENRLRQLESVITNTKDAVLIANTTGNDSANPIIIYVNDACALMTGHTPGELIGQPLLSFLRQSPSAVELSRLEEAFIKCEHCEVELKNQRKNGEDFWMNVSVAPVADSGGRFTHWISIQRDITDRKQRELEKEQLIKELNQSNEDLKHFSYITSHNFKAPLSNLIGFLNIVDEMSIDNPELLQIIQGFRVSTHLLNDTISDLIDILVIRDSGSIEIGHVRFDKIMKKVLTQLNYQVEESEAEITTDFSMAPSVVFNDTYLESILMNLTTNAIRYRSYSRKVKINIKTKYEGDFVILTFEDNGIGIDLKRHREKMFGLYQRFHDRPDSKGMGLYLIKSQLEALGGAIDVESKIDCGTRFILKFKVRYDKQATLH
ncbi:PAS domain S-box protein [Emticicia sp. TH156]|uniref:PAS domain S-box protein n=1 Tax=Emticicia sp. TH156 TaxID=2067454 RepID=UPI000C76A2FA|nr:PAS domain S-box protein [Emticicia sp. TH156]PLK45207.1 hypothetical protein C0V77_08240 [Emticicia sp. TH156]